VTIPGNGYVIRLSHITHYKGTDNRTKLRIIKYVDVLSSLFFRHRQGQKVEGQGHKVKWKLCKNIKYMPKTSSG